MNCQDFQNRFDSAEAVSGEAMTHSENCADCRDFQTSQLRVRELLQGLQRVEAPKNFNFLVKARIAKRKERNQIVPFFSSLRYILPFASILLVISALAIGGILLTRDGENNFAGTENSPSTQSAEAPRVENVPALPQPANNFVETDSEIETPAPVLAQKTQDKPAKQKSPAIAAKPKVEEGGGSRDLAVTSVAPVIQPEFNSNRTIEIVPDANRTTIRSLSEILKISGIGFTDGKVVSVAKNSLAERSGIQVGDAVDAVNGKKIASGEISGDQISIKTITVIRNGESIEVVLKN